MSIPAPATAPTAQHRRPQLIATDLDGTLLRSDGTVSDRTRAALRGAAAAGIGVVFVSARPARLVAPIAEQAGAAGHAAAICSNGAVHYNLETGLLDYAFEFSTGQISEAARLVRAALPEAGFAVETGEQVFRETRYRPGLVTGHAAIEVADVLEVWPQAGRFVKLMVKDVGRSADEVVAMTRAVLGPGVEVSQSGARHTSEVAPGGATKAAGLALLCARRGIPAAAVAAFGDMHNDLPMLAWAGLPYAVANAHPEVLAAVPGRAGANDEDGVAAVIEGWLG